MQGALNCEPEEQLSAAEAREASPSGVMAP